ncbi:hypothetical protein [Capnocytophaga catalasegens]|uniref:BIG2 domain-containing protein n=1 Tax=Capnocytophaga catalasegens TaxID=1004260 RepID=A0AAV5AW01_9FLAO|nr:hypothetical protein [Capnocytophaga catalasegens]GIZ15323.1 hypothetical protein RCZ03_13230 [Capnocytophaga catalasegens]GJM50490.1 hypothetical protein RCZ15_14630 [Capnocytophaga catalasegens]GJM52094.1 hypothetical protein RCZ16_04120 [Capnocytophaga catalasegens]
MKKIGLLLGLTSIGLVGTISCSKDDNKQVEQPVKNLTIDKSEVGLLVGISEIVSITDGNGGYSVKSSDESKVTASVKANQVTIEAKAEGQATVTITDSKEKSVVIKVNVWKSIALDNKSIAIKIGETRDINILSGEGPFSAVSKDKAIAEATIKDKIIIITGVAVGITQVEVTDTKTNKIETIGVSVAASGLVVSSETLVITEKGTKTINIISGSGSYEVTSSMPEIVSISLASNTITVQGLKKGEANITLKDTQSNQTKVITVKVVEKLDIGRKNLTVTQGEEETTQIYSGEPTIFTSHDPTIVTARAAKDGYGDYYIYVRGLKAGSTTIEVSDGDTSYTLNVIVEKAPDLAFVGSSATRNFLVGTYPSAVSITGSGDFTFSSSDKSVAIVELDSFSFEKKYFLNINAKKAGTANVTITDKLSGQSIVLTINVE